MGTTRTETCGGGLNNATHFCAHSDLFNLPLPPLWTVVLGEFNRHVESGYEQRISVDRIVMHQDYENYQHDLGMNAHALMLDIHS